MKSYPIVYKFSMYIFAEILFMIFLISSCMADHSILNNPYQKEGKHTKQKADPVSHEELKNLIQQKLDSASKNKYIVFNQQKIISSNLLKAFYIKNNFYPVWLDTKGVYSITKKSLDMIKDSKSEGLDPEYYFVNQIESSIMGLRKYDKTDKIAYYNYLADLELLITNSNLTYFSNLIFGHYNLSKIFLDNLYTEPYIDLVKLTHHAININDFNTIKDSLLPKSPVYNSLKSALLEYEQIKKSGGWPYVSTGPKLVKGVSNPRVIQLKKRLYTSKDLKLSESDLETYLNNELFDDYLELSVKNFQNRHGLKPDGVVGKNTLKSINITVDEKIHSIKLNLDIWRRLPQDLGQRYILVNVPAFKLFGYENNNTTIEMRVIVGRLDWNTPIFSEYMEYIVVNPYWNIPRAIFEDEILPELITDPTYLAKKNIKILGPEAESIDPKLLDWTTIDPKSWDHRLRQEPGSANPLGRLKFMFPNKHSVYLHDTPNKSLFNKNNRILSHGCIRVEEPLELAEFVFSEDSEWNGNRVQNLINSRTPRTVYLKQPIPVHILYFTAWVENDGSINFRNDIYKLISPDKLQTSNLL